MEMSSWALLTGWLITIGIAFSSLGKRPMPQNIVVIADHKYDNAQIMEVIMAAREIIRDTQVRPELELPLLAASVGTMTITTTVTTTTTTSV